MDSYYNSLLLTRKDSSSNYSNTCCHAIDPEEWVSRGETTLWLWRLQLLNISDNSKESLRVKSRLWPFWESDLGRSRSRVVVVVERQEVTQDASIVTRDKYKHTWYKTCHKYKNRQVQVTWICDMSKYTCTYCKRIVTCDSIGTDKYIMCKYRGLWQVL